MRQTQACAYKSWRQFNFSMHFRDCDVRKTYEHALKKRWKENIKTFSQGMRLRT